MTSPPAELQQDAWCSAPTQQRLSASGNWVQKREEKSFSELLVARHKFLPNKINQVLFKHWHTEERDPRQGYIFKTIHSFFISRVESNVRAILRF